MTATKGDKKSVAGQARYVILKEIGKVEEKKGRFVEEAGDEEVMKAILGVTPAKAGV